MYRVSILLVAVAISVTFVACGEDEVGTDFSDLCPDKECVSCDSDDDCDGETYCHPEGVCAAWECEPHSQECDDGVVTRCAADGSGYEEAEVCDSGVCGPDGGCGCVTGDTCADDEFCRNATCVHESQVPCILGGSQCFDDEICVGTEVCDEDGECEEFRECRIDCDGEVCGFESEFCCTGDTPVCGPLGECAPDCSDGGGLCGENFDECCAFGEACIFGECRTMGEECEHFTDCPVGQYCDQGLGVCMPDDFPEGLVCEDDYDFADIEPEVLWRWEGVEIGGDDYKQVMMTPLVADMTGDGIPDVVVNAYAGTGANSYPVVINGATGETSHYYDYRHSNFGAQLALVDITGNGIPEIVSVDNGSGGIGVIENFVDCPEPQDDPDGCYVWWNDSDVFTDQGAPVVGDFNADSNIEILLRDTILDGMTGEAIATLDAGGYDYPIAVDITGDGKLELLGAGCLYSLDGDRELTELWCTSEDVAAAGKRYAGAGDVTDRDGRGGMPEIVIVGEESVFVVAGDTGDVLHIFEIPGGGQGGPPIIADFDGDGIAEIGVAGAVCYTVYDLDCVVEDGEDPREDRPGCVRPEIEACQYGQHCACEALADTKGTGDGVLWSIYVQDESSQRTGSSVFDFQGNGRNEVVYNDECLLMVLDGQDGSPYFIYGNTNRTSSEYPIIVDVDGDNRTNIVVSANNDQFGRDCEDPIATQPERFPDCHPEDPEAEIPAWCTEGTNGVIALQDPEDRWVRTRSVWNQFDYYIDNATDSGGVITQPAMPWESHNTFRANRQGEVPLNAPDVAVTSVQVNALACPADIDFQVTIENQGVAAIPAGLPITLYLLGVDEPQALLTVELADPISPGGVASVAMRYVVSMGQINVDLDFMVVANADGTGEAPVRDCNPDTATSLVEGVICAYQL